MVLGMDMQMTVSTHDAAEDAAAQLVAAGFRASVGNRRMGDSFSVVSVIDVAEGADLQVEDVVRDVDPAASRLA